jgi:hypothetical protein
MRKADFKNLLMRNNIPVEVFCELVGTTEKSLNRKQTVTDSYVAFLNILIENRRLKEELDETIKQLDILNKKISLS